MVARDWTVLKDDLNSQNIKNNAIFVRSTKRMRDFDSNLKIRTGVNNEIAECTSN